MLQDIQVGVRKWLYIVGCVMSTLCLDKDNQGRVRKWLYVNGHVMSTLYLDKDNQGEVRKYQQRKLSSKIHYSPALYF